MANIHQTLITGGGLLIKGKSYIAYSATFSRNFGGDFIGGVPDYLSVRLDVTSGKQRNMFRNNKEAHRETLYTGIGKVDSMENGLWFYNVVQIVLRSKGNTS
jgi:hypothetical protein